MDLLFKINEQIFLNITQHSLKILPLNSQILIQVLIFNFKTNIFFLACFNLPIQYNRLCLFSMW